MKNKLVKRIAVGTGTLFGLLVLVLCIHIYMVTRPRPIDPKAIVMARIDMHQDIDQADITRIVNYMDAQPCVNHTYVNPNSQIVVFTFFPARSTGDEIVKKFKADLHYDHAARFKPTLAQLSGGCPAGYGAGSSISSKIANLFK